MAEEVLYPRKTAAKVYEALLSPDKKDFIVKECSEDDVVNFFVRKALKSMIDFADREDVATGLTRLEGMEQERFESKEIAVTEINIESEVGSGPVQAMLEVSKYFKKLIKKDDSSSISSSEVVDADLDGAFTDEELLYKYVMEHTFAAAEKRGLERDDFEQKAREIFKDGDTLNATLNRVVPEDYEPSLHNNNAQGTQDSDVDVLLRVAATAFHQWCEISHVGAQKQSTLNLALFKG